MSKKKSTTSTQKADAAALAASEKSRNAAIAEIDERLAKPANAAPSEAKPLAPAKPKKSKAAKPAKPRKSAKATKPAKAAGEKKLSALDAAAQILSGAKEPMNPPQLIEAMAKQGLWTSPGGLTPAATLSAALGREVKTRGKDSRFKKVGRELFAATGVKG